MPVTTCLLSTAAFCTYFLSNNGSCADTYAIRTANRRHAGETWSGGPVNDMDVAMWARDEILQSWMFLFREGTHNTAYKALEAPMELYYPPTGSTRARLWYEKILKTRMFRRSKSSTWSSLSMKDAMLVRIQFWYEKLVKRLKTSDSSYLSMKDVMATHADILYEVDMHAGHDPMEGSSHPSYENLRRDIKKHKQMAYSYFTVYGHRIRMLRKYMDECKPNDFWGLIHDRRNKLQYFTFWSVIAVGLLSILLGFMSLAVGIVQAVFAYRALNVPVAATTANPSLTT